MKIFIDSANLDEIKKSIALGVIDGATTNPSLIAKEKGMDFKTLAKDICKMVPGPVSLEVVSLEAKEMVKEGKELNKLAKNVVIKVPMTVEGIKATKQFTKLGIKTNVTLVFSANQAMLAAKVGATYVSPFVGRLDDMGQNGIELLEEIRVIFDHFKYKTQILSASIRHTDHIKQSALVGCDVATIPFGVLSKMYNHALTDKGLKAFLKDWESVKKK